MSVVKVVTIIVDDILDRKFESKLRAIFRKQ